jgi:hypothetical protein
MYYEVKSNYTGIDSLILEDRKKSIEEKKEKPHIIKFIKSKMYEFDECGVSGDNPSIYSLEGDSLFLRGTFRQDEDEGKIIIVKDTLYWKLNAIGEFNSFLLDLKWDYKMDIPKDIKIEKMVRHVVCVRVPDCDRYKE